MWSLCGRDVKGNSEWQYAFPVQNIEFACYFNLHSGIHALKLLGQGDASILFLNSVQSYKNTFDQCSNIVHSTDFDHTLE